MNDYGTVRPMLDLGLGIGWGMYAFDNQYHFDFLATYDFNVYWNQNMMRTLADDFAIGVPSSNDLFQQGLTLRAQFDF